MKRNDAIIKLAIYLNQILLKGERSPSNLASYCLDFLEKEIGMLPPCFTGLLESVSGNQRMINDYTIMLA